MGCGVCHASKESVVDKPEGKLKRGNTKTYAKKQTERIDASSEMEVELQNLKHSMEVLLKQNEHLKSEMNRDMSALFPQVFTDVKFPEEIVDDWLIMDLFEMDKFVNFLKVLHPPIEDLVAQVMYTSAVNKTKETSLTEYLDYFKYRYEETGKIMTIMGQERHDIDDCVQATKTKIVQSIKVFEAFFGKKSHAVDELAVLFGKIGGLQVGVPFISGLQVFYEAALEFYRQAYEAKLEAAAEAKEQMRQHYEQLLRERDAHFDRMKKHLEDIIYKKSNAIDILRTANHVDIENQFDHFDMHLRKLKREFAERLKMLREEYEGEVERLKEEVEQRDLRIGLKEKEILELNGFTNDVQIIIHDLEENKRMNEERNEKIRLLLEEQNHRIEFLDDQMIEKGKIEAYCEDLKEELSETMADRERINNELQMALRQISVQHSELALRETHRLGEKGKMGETWRRANALRIATRLIARARIDITAVVEVWKTLSLSDLEFSSGAAPRAPYPLNISDDVVHEVYTDAQQQFSMEIQQTLFNVTLSQNDLLDYTAGLEMDEKPMLTFHIFKIFEEMMARKYDSDCYEIRHQRIPKPIPMFLVEHLARTMGLQPLAVRAVAQYMPRLKELFDSGHEYGLVICQLLQVFVDNPAHNVLGWFLTRALSHFDLLTEKYTKTQADIKRRRGLKPQAPPGTTKKKPPTKPYYGKIAFLQDLIPMVATMFEGNTIAGEHVVRWLKPVEVTDEEYTAFVICERIAKLGRSSESVFKLLDPTNKGTITESEFVTRVRETVEVCMMEVELRKLFRASMKGEKRMTSGQFANCVNFKVYPQNCVSKVYAATTCTFLSVMIRVFQENEKVFTMQTKRFLEKRHLSSVNSTDFKNVMRDIDPTVTEKELQTLWALALSELRAQAPLTIEQFAMVPLLHPIGSLGQSVFCERYTDEQEVVKKLRSSPHSRANSYSDNAAGAYLGGQQIG